MSEKLHNVEIVKVDEIFLYLNVDGQFYRIQWDDCSAKLAKADHAVRQYIDISPAGYGLYWPLVDEDLAIDPLLQYAEKLVAESV